MIQASLLVLPVLLRGARFRNQDPYDCVALVSICGETLLALTRISSQCFNYAEVLESFYPISSRTTHVPLLNKSFTIPMHPQSTLAISFLSLLSIDYTESALLFGE